MNDELDFKIFTRRHNKYDTYKIRKTPTGWHVKFLVHTGECDPKGEPYLYKNFRQDYVSYPKDLPEIMEHFWEVYHNYTFKEVQDKINRITEWVNACEHAYPEGIY